MWALGFVLATAGGGWILTWAIERTLARHGISQAFGGMATPEARAEADARGEAHQRRMVRATRRGLWPAVVFLAAGIVIVSIAPK